MRSAKFKGLVTTSFVIAALAALVFATPVAVAGGPGKNGTTLAGYKTLDICSVPDAAGNPSNTWRYSGDIAVWNQGAIDTIGFKINDCLQTKTITGGTQFVDVECRDSVTNPQVFDPSVTEIPAGTTQLTALTFAYSFEAPAWPVDVFAIKNVANLTILNHSGQTPGTPFGPSPKTTWDGGVPPLCAQGSNRGCTYTQGYWGNKPGVVWPSPYSRTANFFLATNLVCTANCGGNPNDDLIGPGSTQYTWQNVLDTPANQSQGYYQLAHQYIAAVLNIAKTVNPAVPPQGVQETLNLAQAWLTSNGPAACVAAGSCGVQKDWAAVLDDFNNGVYPDGPLHCSDENTVLP
jgi:hypothetical protein